MMTPVNFAPIWAKLSAQERRTCAAAVAKHYLGEDWHSGLLPFHDLWDVVAALRCESCNYALTDRLDLANKCVSLYSDLKVEKIKNGQ